MTHDGQVCPLDASPLVYLSGSYGEKGIDLSVYYCPRCDLAVILLAPARAATPPAVLQWHPRGGQLKLREEDRQRWAELPRQFREAWESNIRQHVSVFLRRRHSEDVRCPLDNSRIPVLQGWRDEAGTSWLLSWCKWCRMGFVFASDLDYGWEYCAGVVWHSDRRAYELVRQLATAARHVLSPQLLVRLPPLPADNDKPAAE